MQCRVPMPTHCIDSCDSVYCTQTSHNGFYQQNFPHRCLHATTLGVGYMYMCNQERERERVCMCMCLIVCECMCVYVYLCVCVCVCVVWRSNEIVAGFPQMRKWGWN